MKHTLIGGCLCLTSLATLAAFLGILLVFSVPDQSFGKVAASANISEYGFGPHMTLLLLNLTAYASPDDSDIDERGLNGANDIHPRHKRFAQLTMYKNGQIFNNVVNHPVAIDQKGGSRYQINIGIEFRDPADITEDDKAELLSTFDTDLEDYFLRGCYFESSCTRDFGPTVMDVTPPMKGELVEVLFWQHDIGYTYEGVYGLFAKMRRKYYQKAVPWDSKGKIDKETPCADSLEDIAVVFESEVERRDRGIYNAFERMVQADMVYPSSSNEAYFQTWSGECTEKYNQVVDYFHLPNWLNHSVVPLNLTTFVQMYMASQLLQQVDFGFRGAQQYYYKSPGSMDLMTGPPYDFDAPWDLCGIDKDTVDIVSCHGEVPSPLWSRMGRNSEFVTLWKTTGIEILDRNMVSIRNLYKERIELYDRGYFKRHEERWSMSGRMRGDIIRHFIALARERVIDGSSRNNIGDELAFQLEWYEDRYQRMRGNIPKSDGFDVHVTWGPYYLRFMQAFWWVFVFAAGPVCILCGWGAIRALYVARARAPTSVPEPTVCVSAICLEQNAKRRYERR